MSKIGSQDGIVAFHNRQRDLDPAGTLLVKGKDGRWPDMNQALAGVPVDQWKAIDKHQRTEQILKDDHDTGASGGSDFDYLVPAQARIFLAQAPLDCLNAPPWMVPVCSADRGYRDQGETNYYTPDVIAKLRERFGTVEAWCDCRVPSGFVAGVGTGYDVACQMVDELDLDGPAWGQCETEPEFDNAYNGGARRMVGQLAGLRDDQRDRIGAAEVLLAFELYRNKMPWQVPDYGDDGAGVGGTCIGVYASDSEGATYYPVSRYKDEGYYTPGRSSVYGVGLMVQDWIDLA
jgi:hypothetical protein